MRGCLERAGLLQRRRPHLARHYTPPMGVCRIIPLGGLGEVGKNMTVFEAEGVDRIVDAGLAFPRDEHLGVDLVLPDFTYLRERETSPRRSCSRTATKTTSARCRTCCAR